MRSLASQDRFEEAALVRDRGGALARALDRQFRVAALADTEWLVVELDGRSLRIDRGRLRFAPDRPAPSASAASPRPRQSIPESPNVETQRLPDPVERRAIDEMMLLVREMERHAARRRVLVVDAERPWQPPAWTMPRFIPRDPADTARLKESGTHRRSRPQRVARHRRGLRQRPQRRALRRR
jgi:hypothetical protein